MPSSSVTHHVDAALIPAESGKYYAQQVMLKGDTLTFTNREGRADGDYVRRKIWERVSSASP